MMTPLTRISTSITVEERKTHVANVMLQRVYVKVDELGDAVPVCIVCRHCVTLADVSQWCVRCARRVSRIPCPRGFVYAEAFEPKSVCLRRKQAKAEHLVNCSVATGQSRRPRYGYSRRLADVFCEAFDIDIEDCCVLSLMRAKVDALINFFPNRSVELQAIAVSIDRVFSVVGRRAGAIVDQMKKTDDCLHYSMSFMYLLSNRMFEKYKLREAQLVNAVGAMRNLIRKMNAVVVSSLVNVEKQMDTMVDMAERLVLESGKAATSVVKKAMSSGLKALQDCDSPAVLRNSAGDFALVDAPKEVTTLAFQTRDIAGGVKSNFCQDDSTDVHDILGRCKRPSLQAAGTWTTVQTIGTDLLQPARSARNTGFAVNGVAPWYPFSSTGTLASIEYVHTALSAYSRMYRYWRGSLKYTLEVQASRFVEGQIYMCYQPSRAAGVQTPTLEQAQNCMGVMIDLSMCNRIEFVVPYNNVFDYLLNPRQDTDSAQTQFNNMGQIFMFVQSPLMTSNAAAGSVADWFLWVQPEDDFKFYVPRPLRDDVKINGAFVNVPPNPALSHVERQMEQQELQQAKLAETGVAMPSTGFKTADDALVNCRVDVVNYGDVMHREYLLRTGIQWSNTSTFGQVLAQVPLRAMFIMNENIAPKGMIEYHTYIRSSFEITLRANPIMTMSGMAALVYIPSGINSAQVPNFIADGIATLTQLPISFLTPQTTTEARIRIPWSYIRRLMYVNMDETELGYVAVVAYTPLRDATARTLNMALYGRMVEPHLTFKRAIVPTGAIQRQMEGQQVEGTGHGASGPKLFDLPTDTMGQTGCGTMLGRNVEAKSPFSDAPHMDERALMRRPDFCFTTAPSTVIPDDSLREYMAWPIRPAGQVHRYLATTHQAWSGSNRYYVVTDAAMVFQGRCVLLQDITTSSLLNVGINPPPGGLTSPGHLFLGSSVWYPATVDAHVVQMPQYSQNPSLFCQMAVASPFRNGDTDSLACGNARFYMMAHNSTTQIVGVWIYHSIGDDFEFYMTLPFPPTRPNANPPLVREEWMSTGVNVYSESSAQRSGWIRDLTREGVEPNPGPVHSKLLSSWEQEVCEMIDRKVADCRFRREAIWNDLCDWIKTKVGSVASDAAKSVMRERIEDLHSKLVSKVLPSLVWAVDFILNIYVIATSENVTARLLALSSLTAKTICAYDWGSELLKQLEEVARTPSRKFDLASGLFGGVAPSNMSNTNKPVKLASPALEAEWSYSAIACAVSSTLVAGMLAVLGIGFAKSDGKALRNLTLWKLGEAAGTASKLSLAVKSVPTLWSSMKSGLTSGMEYFFEGRNTFTNWMEQNEGRIVQWQTEFDNLKAEGRFDANQIFKSVQGKLNYDVLAELQEYALEIRAHGPQIRGFPVTWMRTAEAVCDLFARMHKRFEAISGRIEPIGIWIEGAPGCGKSLVWSKIIPKIVLPRVGLCNVEDVPRNVYFKPSDPEQKYMDGYSSQHWVMCDDFMAGVEDGDVAQMIHLINGSVAHLNMANIEDKDTVFDSNFVCVTSNIRDVTVAASIREKSALTRRFKYSYTMKCRERFLKGKVLDTDLLASLSLKCGTPDEVMDILDQAFVLNELSLVGGCVAREETKVSDVIKRVSDEYMRMCRVNSKFDKILAVDREMEKDTLEQLVGKRTKRTTIDDGMWDAIEQNPLYSVTPTLRLAWYGVAMSAWKAYKAKELTYEVAQRIVRDVRRRITELGWPSWNSFSSDAAGMKPSPLNLKLYTPSTHDDFIRLVVSLMAIPEPEIFRGPPVQKWQGVLKYGLALLGVAGAFVLVYGVYKLAKSYLSKTIAITDVVEEGPQYDPGNAKQPTRGVVKPSASRPVTALKREEEISDIAICVQKNVLRIEISAPSIGMCKGVNCLMLDNKTMLIPNHFYVSYREVDAPDVELLLYPRDRKGDTSMCVVIGMDAVNSEVVVGRSTTMGARDCRLVSIYGFVVPHVKDIKKFFMTRKMRDSMCGTDSKGILLSRDAEQEPLKAVIGFSWCYEHEGEFGLPAKTEQTTQFGDCGRPYLIHGKSFHRPIVGIHCWGVDKSQNTVGIADLTYEDIEETQYKVGCRMYITADVLEPRDENVEIVAEAGCSYWTEPVEILGKLTMNGEKIERFQPSTTGFCRTGLVCEDWLDEFVPTEKRVVVVDGVKVHPLFTHAQKFAVKASSYPSTSIHNKVMAYMCDQVEPLGYPGDLSDLEMINGFGDMNQVVMNTSTGYIQRYFKNGKSELFKATELPMVDGQMQKLEYSFSDKAKTFKIPMLGTTFVDWFNRCEQDLHEGRMLTTFWAATNKDELTEKRKAVIGKTRVFVQPGLEVTLLFRKYFGRFVDWYKSKAGFVWCHGIGRDKEAVWKAYYEELLTGGHNGFDIDYKNYDGTVSGVACEAFLAVTDRFYGDLNRSERHALVWSMFHARMIVGDFVALTVQGNKSGNPCTDVFNSITNFYYMLLAFIVSKAEAGLPVTLDGWEQVRMLTYGDDVICTAPDEVLEYFNRVTVARTLAVLGMDVTSGSKSGEMVACDPLEVLTFLKSTFVEVNGVVYSPLPKKVIHRELMWGKKVNQHDLNILHQKVDAGVRMMAHHGKAATEELLEQLRKQGVKFEFSWDDWNRELVVKQDEAKIDRVEHAVFDEFDSFYFDFDSFFYPNI